MARDLPYVTFGDSDKVQVDQGVVAIGQTRNLVPGGIVGAKQGSGEVSYFKAELGSPPFLKGGACR